jgi:Ca2+-binding RTX toxin-like protein
MSYDDTNLTVFNGDTDNNFTGNSEEEVIIGGNGNDTLAGGGDDDILIGYGGNNFLSGEEDDDLLSGGTIRIINNDDTRFEITGNKTGIDTLTGGEGENIFILGGNPSDTLGENAPQIDFYNQAGSDDYALITDFDTDDDTIVLGSSRGEYTIGTPPSDLPTGTGIFKGDDLIAIAQNAELDLGGDYFQFET